MKVDLFTAKSHLRVDGDAEDELIGLWVSAAYRAVEGKIFRKVLDESPPAVDPPDGSEIPLGPDARSVWAWPDINAAALLILGHLYANREAVTDGARVEVPMGAEWLLTPYINYAAGA